MSVRGLSGGAHAPRAPEVLLGAIRAKWTTLWETTWDIKATLERYNR